MGRCAIPTTSDDACDDGQIELIVFNFALCIVVLHLAITISCLSFDAQDAVNTNS